MLTLPDNQATSVSPEIPGRELADGMRWVIGIRWTVVAALLFVGFAGSLSQGRGLQISAVHIILAFALALYNLIFMVVLSRVRRGHERLKRPAESLRFAQIPIDLLAFTLIIHFSGGVTGPVFVLYFLYVFVGLATLPPASAYYVAGTAALLYGLLALVEVFWLAPIQSNPVAEQTFGAISPWTYLGYFLTVSATLMITAYIANYFAGMLTRDERTIREQLSESNSLYTFTRAISTTISSDEVARTLVATALQIEKANVVALILFNDKGDGIFAEVQDTSGKLSTMQGKPVPAEHEFVRTFLTDGKGVYGPDVDTVPHLRRLLLRPHTRSFYAIPMLSERRLIGSLNLSFDRQYTMPWNRWNLLSAMNQQAALSIERTRLFVDAQRSAREMTGLYHIGLATTSSLKIDEVLHLIYEQVNRVLHPDTFYIALYDEDVAELRYDIFIEAGQALQPFKARLDGMGVSSWVIRNRKPIFVKHWDNEIEQLPFQANVVGAPTQSVISVPLIAKNKIVGVMSVQAVEPARFDQNHLRLLTSIAGQAALALENAKLHATVREQAQRDSLTGAYNHGTFIDKMHSAIREGHQEKHKVALIMLDIDRFKQYNDNYGHMIGDDVLRSTVAAIQNHVKSTDTVGRWGGEEFGIILSNVTRAQARAIAERIRQTVSLNTMKDLHNRSIPSPTVSQGIAIYPEDATQVEELIDKADSALFRAKDLGRDKIAEWIEMDQPPEPLSLVARG